MRKYSQGDIIRIEGYKNLFLIVSRNKLIEATQCFHVCPILEEISEGPLHIAVKGISGTTGTVLCEQIKLIDAAARSCMVRDCIAMADLINISDAIQGMFEYL